MIKKTILVFLISCIYSLFISAQSKHTVSLTLGGAVPVGDYPSTDVYLYKSNAAKAGYTANIQYTYNIVKYMGLTSILGVTVNPVNVSAIENYYNNLIPNYTQIQNLKINPYTKYSLMLGLQGRIPLSKKLDITPYVLGGICYFNKSDESFLNRAVNQFNYSGKSSQNFSYQFGLGLEYHYYKNWILIAKLDYNYTKLNIDEIITILKPYQKLSLGVPYSINATTINPSLGIGYKF